MIAEIDRAKVDLDHCTITSPIDGMVISRSVDVGQTVAASLFAPVIFTIANDLGKMQIDQRRRGRCRRGRERQAGRLYGRRVSEPHLPCPARLAVRNAPTTVQNVVSYDTVIGVNNADLKLKPGMTANVSIVVAQRDNVFKVSNAALRFQPPSEAPATSAASAAGQARRGGGRGVNAGAHSVEKTIYVLKSGSPQPVKIKTGVTDGIFTEVTEGPKEGDQAITAAIGKAAADSATNNPFSGARRRF